MASPFAVPYFLVLHDVANNWPWGQPALVLLISFAPFFSGSFLNRMVFSTVNVNPEGTVPLAMYFLLPYLFHLYCTLCPNLPLALNTNTTPLSPALSQSQVLRCLLACKSVPVKEWKAERYSTTCSKRSQRAKMVCQNRLTASPFSNPLFTRVSLLTHKRERTFCCSTLHLVWQRLVWYFHMLLNA